MIVVAILCPASEAAPKFYTKLLARSAGLIPACPTEVRRACRQAGADAIKKKEWLQLASFHFRKLSAH